MSGKAAKMHRKMSRIMYGGSPRYAKALRKAWDSMTEAEREISGKQLRDVIKENEQAHTALAMQKGVAHDVGPRRF